MVWCHHCSTWVQVKAVRLQQLGLLLDLLQGVPPFAQLPHDKLISLAIFVRPITCTKDCVIAREGDAVDTMYIIQQGTVACRIFVRPISVGKDLSLQAVHCSRASPKAVLTGNNSMPGPIHGNQNSHHILYSLISTLLL